MIILSSGYYTIGNPIFAIGAAIVGVVIIVFLLYGSYDLSIFKEVKTWLILLSMGIVLTICIVVSVNTSKEIYKIYLEDMRIDELETEYDVTDIDGLILKCTKKDK